MAPDTAMTGTVRLRLRTAPIVGLDGLDARTSVFGRLDFEALGLERLLHGVAHVLIVIYDQNSGHG
jgi:hypothetical protein